MENIPLAIKDLNPVSSELSKIYIPPYRILWYNEKINDAENIMKNTEYQAVVNESDHEIKCAVLNPGASILIDFGKELCGGVKLFTKSVLNTDGSISERAEQCSIRLRFGESADEAMAELHEKGTTNDHSPRDFPAVTGVLSMPEFGYTGFRFVRIDNTDPGKILFISSVCAYAYFRDIEYKGCFKSNDELINRIFDTAAYTLHLCMQEYIWDGIKRDRIVWIGDMYPEISALCSVFGYDPVVEKSLDIVRDNTAPEKFANGIITYSAWWLIIQYRWYMQNGRISYLKQQHKRIIETIKLLGSYVRNDGYFDPKNTWPLFDWPSNYSEELKNSGAHSIIKIMFDNASFLLDELGDSENSSFCKEKSAIMMKAEYKDFDYKQISAMRVFAGIREAKKESERLLSKNGASGISTFLGMFTFAAESEAGDTKKALENLRGLYGKMLEVGATSFWEDFDPAWCENAGRIDELTPKGTDSLHGDRGAYCYVGFRHSLCHGWSSGVCAYISEYILGIKITKPGCREIMIEPHPGGLDSIEGTYPTPYGIISVKHTKNADGTYTTEYNAPKEVKVTVLPASD